MKFNELNLSENIIKALNNLGYKNPSEVQEASIPKLLKGEDIIVKSQTGSGKTASFGIDVYKRQKHSLPREKLGIRKRQPLREGCLFCLIKKIILYKMVRSFFILNLFLIWHIELYHRIHLYYLFPLF